MLNNVTNPAVLIALIICSTILYLARTLRISDDKKIAETLDQLVEDHSVFSTSLESVNRRIDESNLAIKKHDDKISNIAIGKVFK